MAGESTFLTLGTLIPTTTTPFKEASPGVYPQKGTHKTDAWRSAGERLKLTEGSLTDSQNGRVYTQQRTGCQLCLGTHGTHVLVKVHYT